MTTTDSVVTFVTPSLTVSKQVNGKRQAIGEFPCFTPLLNAFGLAADVVRDDEGKAVVNDEGFPEYADNAMNWLFTAVVNHAKTSARNKLTPGTADLAPNRSWSTTLEELVAPVVRSGSAALAERSALFSLWNSYIDSLGRQPAVAALAKAFMKQPDSVIAQPQKVKDAVQGWLSDFVEAHGDELTEYQANHIGTVLEACETDAADLDW